MKKPGSMGKILYQWCRWFIEQATCSNQDHTSSRQKKLSRQCNGKNNNS